MTSTVTERPLAEIKANREAVVAAYLRHLHPPGDVFEIRALGISEYDNTFAGYFDNADVAAEHIVRCDIHQQPRGIYCTLNPVQNELLGRINNRLKRVKRGETSSDVHVTRRRWLFVDLDPERAGGISGIPATDAEQFAALERAADVRDWLMSEFGWHEPIELDSGNGRYLLFPIDLPNDADALALIKRVLMAIASKWSDDAVKIDSTVSNAARIARVLGTVNRKGDPTPERPHRFCNSLHGPDYLDHGWADPIPREKLEAVAALAPEEKPKGKPKNSRKTKAIAELKAATNEHSDGETFNHRLMVEDWLTARQWGFHPPHKLADGRDCWQIQCPFNPDHGFDAAVMQAEDGGLSGHCHHHSCADNGWQQFKEAIGKPDAEHYDPPLGDGVPHPILSGVEGRTELANSRRFVAKFRDELRYVPAWRRWLAWDDKRWSDDISDVGVMQRAKLIADEVWDATKALMTDDTIKFAQATAKHSGCRAMVNLAASDLPIDHTKLDADPWLLNCMNGTVDLRTGELRPHNPGDLLTKLSPIKFDPAATCPRFLRFLAEVFPGEGLAAFVQRLIGYCITGDVREHVLPIFWGGGSNGKSTLLTTLQAALGDYASQAPASLLIEQKTQQHPTEVAGLFGRRFVVASETESSHKLAEGLVKQLTGGDVICARRMKEDFWNFAPTHKLILCTNHKPKVRGTDHGIWRRLLLVPFTEKFDDTRKDATLGTALLAELPGILAWAVQGCRNWQAGGLRPPAAVQAAIVAYRSEEDVIGRFVTGSCLVGQSVYRVKFSDFYDSFKIWCDDSGENLPSRKSIGNWLKDNDFQERQSNGRWYLGIALKEECAS